MPAFSVTDRESMTERCTQKLLEACGGDVAGLGLDMLEREQVDEVVACYPRLGLKAHVVGPLMAETSERPCCRTAFLRRSLGFVDRIHGHRVFTE